MRLPFEKGLLRYIDAALELLRLVDPEVAATFEEAEMQLHCAVPWLLTGFSHVLSRADQILRLFDVWVTAHPAAALYCCVAVLERFRAPLLALPREMPEVHSYLSHLPWDAVDVDALVERTCALLEEHPPEAALAHLRGILP